jgi:cobalt-zinc-cadmium efflux system outer membrane protein
MALAGAAMHTAHRAACAGYFLLILVVGGCRWASAPIDPFEQTRHLSSTPATPPHHPEALPTEPLMVVQAQQQAYRAAAESPATRPVRPVSYPGPAVEEVPSPLAQIPGQLEVEPLVAEVLSRNPNVRSAVAAWRAAAQRYPQEVSLDDPMFGFMLGPDSWGSEEVDSAYMLEASQKIPWPGKRRLKGNIAAAQADAAYHDVGEQQLRIAEATRLAYYQYYLVHRQLAVLAESKRLLENFREIAKSKYESALVEQQDLLLADVELAELERRLIELTRAQRVARARINTLLLTEPTAPLPPPAAKLAMVEALPLAEELRGLALAQRPELAAQSARIRAERYAVALARKEFYPDMEFVARYDAFWQEEPLRPMVGMNLNVPVYKQKRWAAVREASARIAQQEAALEAQINEISFEVEQAYQRVVESRQTLEIFQQRILPRSRHSVEAARASYIAGRLDFLRLIESQRQLLSLEDRFYQATAEYHQRLAELQRLVGIPPPG